MDDAKKAAREIMTALIEVEYAQEELKKRNLAGARDRAEDAKLRLNEAIGLLNRAIHNAPDGVLGPMITACRVPTW